MSEAMKEGWMIFSEYCKSRSIKQNGYHLRKLHTLDKQYMVNLTPTNKLAVYAVNTKEADIIFNKTGRF